MILWPMQASASSNMKVMVLEDIFCCLILKRGEHSIEQ